MKIRFNRDKRSVGVRIGRWWIRLCAYPMDDYETMARELMLDSLIYGHAFVRVAPDEVIQP